MSSKFFPYGKIHVKAFATVVALVWMVLVICLGLVSWILGWGVPLSDVLASVYLGFIPSLRGLLFGAVWALLTAWPLAALTAWLYNFVVEYYIIPNERAAS